MHCLQQRKSWPHLGQASFRPMGPLISILEPQNAQFMDLSSSLERDRNRLPHTGRSFYIRHTFSLPVSPAVTLYNTNRPAYNTYEPFFPHVFQHEGSPRLLATATANLHEESTPANAVLLEFPIDFKMLRRQAALISPGNPGEGESGCPGTAHGEIHGSFL